MITHKLSLLLLSSALLEPPGPTATRPVTFINIRSVLGWMRTINPQLYWLHNNKRLKNNNNKVKRTSLMAQKKKKKSPPQCPSVRSEWPLEQLVVVRARVGDVSCVNDGSVGTQHVLRARAPHSSAGLAVWTCRRVPLLLFVGCFFFFFFCQSGTPKSLCSPPPCIFCFFLQNETAKELIKCIMLDTMRNWSLMWKVFCC